MAPFAPRSLVDHSIHPRGSGLISWMGRQLWSQDFPIRLVSMRCYCAQSRLVETLCLGSWGSLWLGSPWRRRPRTLEHGPCQTQPIFSASYSLQSWLGIELKKSFVLAPTAIRVVRVQIWWVRLQCWWLSRCSNREGPLCCCLLRAPGNGAGSSLPRLCPCTEGSVATPGWFSFNVSTPSYPRGHP